MPLTLIISEGLLPSADQAPTVARLTEAFLRLQGLAGNPFLTPNVIGHVQVLPAGSTFSGGQPAPVAIVEWLTPSFALTDHEVQSAYVAEATDIVLAACGGRLAREHVWVNLKHAVDGMWGIGGRAYTNEALLAAVTVRTQTA